MKILKRIEKIVMDLIRNKLKIAIAESCTGGYVSHMITNISGASNVFERGIVCYSNKAKMEILNVSPNSLEKHGAVSEDVVKQLACNIRTLASVDIGIGISGIAGPTGGTPDKPVGTVYIGFSTSDYTKVQKYRLKGNRIQFKTRVLEKVIEYLEKISSID